MAILGIVKRRNKATSFKHYGKLVERKNVRRFLGRYKKNPNFSPDVRGMFRQLGSSLVPSNRMS